MAMQASPPQRATASRRTVAEPKAVGTTSAQRPSTRSPGTAPRRTASARQVASTSARQGKKVTEVTAGESQRVAGEAKARSQEVARVARKQTKAVARSAGADARELTDTIKSQALEVRDELTTQTRALAEEARVRLGMQAHTQVRRAADGLSKLGRSTEKLAGLATDEASGLQEYLFQGANKINSAAERVQGLADDVEAGEFEAIVDEVRGFARRRPMAFLTVAALAGFGVGRIVRTSTDDTEEGDGTEAALLSRAAAGTRRSASRGASVRADRGIAL